MEAQVLLKALYCKYHDALLGKKTVPGDSNVLDLTTDAGKRTNKAKAANWIAYAALASVCEETVLGIAEEFASTPYLMGTLSRLGPILWSSMNQQLTYYMSKSRGSLHSANSAERRKT